VNKRLPEAQRHKKYLTSISEHATENADQPLNKPRCVQFLKTWPVFVLSVKIDKSWRQGHQEDQSKKKYVEYMYPTKLSGVNKVSANTHRIERRICRICGWSDTRGSLYRDLCGHDKFKHDDKQHF